MFKAEIPGRGQVCYSHLVLDYNGTIAEDGILIEGVRERLEQLSPLMDIVVVTADTHGTAADQCKDLPVTVLTYPTADVGVIKENVVKERSGGVICVGNGFNDMQMTEAADLSVTVIGPEGCYGGLLSRADIVTTSILDALDLFCKPNRLRAALRT